MSYTLGKSRKLVKKNVIKERGVFLLFILYFLTRGDYSKMWFSIMLQLFAVVLVAVRDYNSLF